MEPVNLCHAFYAYVQMLQEANAAIAKAMARPSSKAGLIAGITSAALATVAIVAIVVALALSRMRKRQRDLKSAATTAVAGEQSEERYPGVPCEQDPELPAVRYD